MTNYEFVRSFYPTGVDSGSYGKLAKELYEKRQSVPTNLVVKPIRESFEKWMFAEADIALKFNIGELLVTNDGEYAIAKSYWQSNSGDCQICRVRVETVKGEVDLPATCLKHADIPKSIVEIARRSVACPNLDRCPLKDEGACMRKED